METRWIIDVDRLEAASGLDWARDFLARYDTAELAEVRIGRGRGKTRGVYGRCWYPVKGRARYRISCQVPGPFPCRIETRRPPIYRQPDGAWPPIPEGCRGGLHCRGEAKGEPLEWRRVIGYTEVRNMDEAITWIMAHEMFHFLRRTRQVAGRNTEIEADRFADEQLHALRRLRERWTRA